MLRGLCSLINQLSNGPVGACYGLLWELLEIVSGVTKLADHPSVEWEAREHAAIAGTTVGFARGTQSLCSMA